jgi:hypothetical protein
MGHIILPSLKEPRTLCNFACAQETDLLLEELV